MKKYLTAFLVAMLLLTVIPFGAGAASDFYYQDFEDLAENASVPGTISGTNTVVSKGGILGKAAKISGRWLTVLSSAISGEILIEMDFMQETKGNIYAILVPQSKGTSGSGFNTPNFPFELNSDGTNINLVHGVKNGTARKASVLVSNYQAGETYSFRFVIDTDEKSLQVWVNGTEALTGENKVFSGADVPDILRFNSQLAGGPQPYFIGKLRVSRNITADGLKSKIDAAQLLYDNAVVGVELGNYTQASKDKLAQAILEAQAIYDTQKNAPDEAVLTAAIAALEDKMAEFEASEITQSVSSLEDLIATAQSKLTTSVFGDQLGLYPLSSKTALETEIIAAQTAASELRANYDLEKLLRASVQLEEALVQFEKSVNTALVHMFEDDFESGVLQSPWQTILGSPSVVEENGNHALRFSAQSTGCRALSYLNAAELSGFVTLEFSYMPEVANTVVHQILEVADSDFATSDCAFVVTSDANAIKLKTRTTTDVLVGAYQPGTWYHFKFDMNIPAGTVKAYVNGAEAFGGETRSLGADFKGLERINSYMTTNNTGSYCVDNFSVTSDILQELKAAAGEVTAQLGDLSAVTTDLILPDRLNDFVSLSWESSDPDVLSHSGAVNRPVSGSQTVSLTMTVKKGDYQYQQILPVTVAQSFVGESVEELVSSDGISSGWSGSAEVITSGGQSYLKINSQLTKSFSEGMIYPDGRLSFRFCQEAKTEIPEIVSLLSDGSVQFGLTSDGENISLVHGGTIKTLIANYEAGRWYQVGLAFDNRLGKAIATVDGNPTESFDFSYQSQRNTVNQIRLHGAEVSRSATEFLLDDLVLGRTVPARIVWQLSETTALRPGVNPLMIPYTINAFDTYGNALLHEKLIKTAKKADGSTANGITFEQNNVIISATADTGALTFSATMPEGGVGGDTVLQLNPQTVTSVRIQGVNDITDAGNYQFTAECLTAQGAIIPATSVTWSVSGVPVHLEQATGQITVGDSVLGVLTISVVADGITATKNVSINTVGGGSFGGTFIPSGGGGGGGGGGAGVAPQIPSKPIVPQEKFTDLDTVSWAKDAILAMEKRGVVKGVSEQEFSPNTRVTRAQFVTMLVRAFNLYQVDAILDFSDVADDSWCYREVASAKALGIVNGVSEAYFGADEAVSREDVAVLLHRTLSYKGLTLNRDKTVNFTDTDSFAAYATEAIEMLCAGGIITGRDDGSFDAKGTATRAEAITLLYRLLLQTEGGK